MRLHQFLRDHRESILAEWETFARTVSPASGSMDVTALRDHADDMLNVIAADLMTSQSADQQSDKSKGLAEDTDITSTAAEEHGAGRAISGFTIEEMVAEYRALRASVLSLWSREVGQLQADDLQDMIRFNEAIDQSLAESVTEFNENVVESKEMFLAILSHDLRTPLGAIYTSAKFMMEAGELKEPYHSLAARIVSSATRTMQMVGDLLDFTRSRLGGGIQVVRKKLHLGKLLHEAIDEISAAHPERSYHVDTRQEQEGEWDGPRLSQALTNLLGNAGEHAPPGTSVLVELAGTGDDVVITIHNMGAVIPSDQLDGLFNPMKSRKGPTSAAQRGPTGNLGLGLYIAERIVHAHGGRIDVESSETGGTTFTVHLPRRGPAAAARP
jgi:signal transduction histidine kinase